VQEVGYVLTHLDQIEPATLLLGTAVVVLLLLAQRYRPHWPNPLIAMLGATAVVAAFDLDQRGIDLVGAIPAGLPAPGLPDVDLATMTELLPAIRVAIVVLRQRAHGRAFGFRHQADRRQQGSSPRRREPVRRVFQGFPVSNGGSRTVIGTPWAAAAVYSWSR
jgi:SulP family sulfate permease